MRIDILHTADCPHWRQTLSDVRDVVQELDRTDITVSASRVDERMPNKRFNGSPTLLIDDVDPFAGGGESHELACRVYRDGERLVGTPPVEQVREAVAARLHAAPPSAPAPQPSDTDVTQARRTNAVGAKGGHTLKSAFTFSASRDDPAGGGAAPRDFVAHPEWFGTFSDPLDPADDIDPADARFLAANTQHWVSNRVREGVLANRTNMASFLGELSVTSPEMTHEHVSRTLHGNEPMTLSDLVVWGNTFSTVREVLAAVFEASFRPTDRD